MAKVTLSVPDELRHRMYSELPADFNLSAAFQRAIEHELAAARHPSVPPASTNSGPGAAAASVVGVVDDDLEEDDDEEDDVEPEEISDGERDQVLHLAKQFFGAGRGERHVVDELRARGWSASFERKGLRSYRLVGLERCEPMTRAQLNGRKGGRAS